MQGNIRSNFIISNRHFFYLYLKSKILFVPRNMASNDKLFMTKLESIVSKKILYEVLNMIVSKYTIQHISSLTQN